MSFRRFSACLTAVTCSLLLALVPPVFAQDEQQLPDPESLDLEGLVETSMLLMQQQRWEDALKYNEAAVKTHGEGAYDSWGPPFGGIYFRKGLCELKLDKYDEAMKSFEKCYKEFPNKKGAEGTNPFEKTCLLPWAEAAMKKEEWQLALDLFDKFVKERDKQRDELPQGSYYISRAICFYNLDKMPDGNENLEIALKNKTAYRIQDSTILGALRYLIEAVIKSGNEQALIDFFDKNRGQITFDPIIACEFTGAFMQLGQNALTKGLDRAAFEIYQLVPSSDQAISDGRTKINDLGPLARIGTMDGNIIQKDKLEGMVKQLEENERNDQSVEVFKLAAVAHLHQQRGNLRGAYAAYRQLEDYHPRAKTRESNLYNLARLSFVVDQGRLNLDDANRFLKFFPNSEYAPLIKQLMLNSLFAAGEYDQCIEIASKLIDEKKVTEKTKDHDVCLHVLGGSYFYTGQYELATKWLDQHVSMYPDSESKVSSAYFQASNAYRLADYHKAIKLLTEFIAKYPKIEENPHLPGAYFDKAYSQYLHDQSEESLKTVDTMLEKFAGSPLDAQAFNLRGNIMNSLQKPIEAEAAYKSGLRAAEKSGNQLIIAESLYNLVGLVLGPDEGQNPLPKPKLEEAVQYVEQFWKKCGPDSPYAPMMAVRQVPVLDQAGRLDEAIERLEMQITAIANSDQPGRLESLQMLDAYQLAFLKKHTADEFRDKFLQFPGVAIGNKEVRALMLIQVIGVYEQASRKGNDPQEKVKADATIKVLFERLKNQFKVDELNSRILIKVANYLRMKTSTPREALPFYNEVIKRNDKEFLHEAILGRAEIYAVAANKADLDKALGDFKRIVDELSKKESPSADDRRQIEAAKFRTIELLLQMEEYDKVIEQANAYLDKDSGHSKSKHAPYVRLISARAYEGKNMTEDALMAYSKTWGGHQGLIQVSAPALKRWMELIWQRNKPGVGEEPGDRQGAYDAGAKFIKLTGHFKMTDEDRALWQEVETLVKQYEANPSIKSLEQQEKEKQN